MNSLQRAYRVLVILWAGSLWSLLWVVAVLFREQPDRHLAGQLAARLFGIEMYLSLAVAVCGLLLPLRSRLRWAYLAAALLAINESVLKALMRLAQAHGTALGLSFGAWHGVSALLYLAACTAALLLVWQDDLR